AAVTRPASPGAVAAAPASPVPKQEPSKRPGPRLGLVGRVAALLALGGGITIAIAIAITVVFIRMGDEPEAAPSPSEPTLVAPASAEEEAPPPPPVRAPAIDP